MYTYKGFTEKDYPCNKSWGSFETRKEWCARIDADIASYDEMLGTLQEIDTQARADRKKIEDEAKGAPNGIVFSTEGLKQLRLTMKALGCVETTSKRMAPGNLRFNDEVLSKGRTQRVDYIIYANTGVVRRHLYRSHWYQSWAPLNGKNPDYDGYCGKKSSIKGAKNEAEALLIAVRGVINYRKAN